MKREEKICTFCKHYWLPTPEVVSECQMEEDMNSEAYCESYEAKE